MDTPSMSDRKDEAMSERITDEQLKSMYRRLAEVLREAGAPGEHFHRLEQLYLAAKSRSDEADELEALRSVVGELRKKTADGIEVGPGDKVYEPSVLFEGRVYEHKVYLAAGPDGDALIEECYSSKEAAEAAGRGGAG